MASIRSHHSMDMKKDDVITTENINSMVDYACNVDARIVNPLAGIPKDRLWGEVDAFCESHGFQNKKETFWKAALVAQNPESFENFPELAEEDKYHIRRETTHRLHLPKDLYFAIALFGLASVWAADPANNYLGRRGAIFATGLFCIFPVLAHGFAQNWQGLLICRMFMGFGMGIKISTIPVYSAEISPASIRGGMVTSFQLWVPFGIFVGQCSNLIFYRIGRLAWRF